MPKQLNVIPLKAQPLIYAEDTDPAIWVKLHEDDEPREIWMEDAYLCDSLAEHIMYEERLDEEPDAYEITQHENIPPALLQTERWSDLVDWLLVAERAGVEEAIAWWELVDDHGGSLDMYHYTNEHAGEYESEEAFAEAHAGEMIFDRITAPQLREQVRRFFDFSAYAQDVEDSFRLIRRPDGRVSVFYVV